jgi:MoaA/NifB/PqqE/SkfB family radical SAM enzyme
MNNINSSNTNDLLKKEVSLVDKYKFSNRYVSSVDELKKQIINKTIIPHQVEFQPGPQSKKICWLSCPYCYGDSAEDNGDRLSGDRLVQIIEEVSKMGVKKVIFAGWATDPLNSKHIDIMLEAAVNNNLIFGFNTKPIKVSDSFLKSLHSPKVKKDSYMSLSIDAGSNEVFNKVHGMSVKAPLYDRCLKNTKNICKANKLKKKIDVSAAYLVNRYNCSEIEILKFINDFRSAGCNLLRFTFAQPPRGKVDQNLDTVPNKQECEDYTRLLEKIVKNEDSDECKILFVDADKENDFFRKPRTLPCVARFIYPTVGFDGKLYHCSQSAAPNFKEIELGNLANNSFRDLYYNYDVSDFKNYFINLGKKMNKVGCRCDRKEHTVNTKIQKSNFLK